MSSCMTWCLIALLNHPDILKRAQKEIDEVVPYGELPTFDDVENKLPLVTTIYMEAIRWRDITPISVLLLIFSFHWRLSLVFQGFHICLPRKIHTKVIHSQRLHCRLQCLVNDRTVLQDSQREVCSITLITAHKDPCRAVHGHVLTRPEPSWI